jgi:hypothetical protein
MGRPDTRELEREFQQQFAPSPQQPLPPPPQFDAPKAASRESIIDSILGSIVGSAQAAPVSGRVSQAPIAPGTLPSGAVANPFGNPTDPNKDQGQVPQGNLWELPVEQGRGKEKEEDICNANACHSAHLG